MAYLQEFIRISTLQQHNMNIRYGNICIGCVELVQEKSENDGEHVVDGIVCMWWNWFFVIKNEQKKKLNDKRMQFGAWYRCYCTCGNWDGISFLWLAIRVDSTILINFRCSTTTAKILLTRIGYVERSMHDVATNENTKIG